MVGLITRLSLLAKNLTAFKFDKVAKSGTAVQQKHVSKPNLRRLTHERWHPRTAHWSHGCVGELRSHWGNRRYGLRHGLRHGRRSGDPSLLAEPGLELGVAACARGARRRLGDRGAGLARRRRHRSLQGHSHGLVRREYRRWHGVRLMKHRLFTKRNIINGSHTLSVQVFSSCSTTV